MFGRAALARLWPKLENFDRLIVEVREFFRRKLWAGCNPKIGETPCVLEGILIGENKERSV